MNENQMDEHQNQEQSAQPLTEESLQKFIDTLESYTQQSRLLAGFINGAYQEAADKTLRKIEERNRKAGKVLEKSISEQLKTVTTQFTEMDGILSETMKKRAVEFARTTMEAEQRYHAMMAEDRQTLVEALDTFAGKYQQILTVVMQTGFQQMSETMDAMITPEQLQLFGQILDAHAEEARELAAFINSTYRDEIRKNIQALAAENRRVQDGMMESLSAEVSDIAAQFTMMDGMIAETMKQRSSEFLDAAAEAEQKISMMLEEFQDTQKAAWAAAVEQQTGLIRRMEPDREKLDKMFAGVEAVRQLGEREVSALEKVNRSLQESADVVWELKKVVQEFQKQMRAENQALRVSVEALLRKEEAEREEERREQRAERITRHTALLLSSGLTVVLFVLLVSFQRPWELMGIKKTLHAAGAGLGIFGLIALLSIVIGKAVAEFRKKP